MGGKHKQAVFHIYKWFTALAVSASLVALAILCFKIYSAGDRAFSREIVAQSLSSVAPLLYFTVVIIITGFVLDIFSTQKTKNISKRDPYSALDFYKKRYALNVDIAQKEEKKRVIIKSVSAVICCVIALFPIWYMADAENFSVEDINADIISAAFAVFIPATVIFCLSLICVYFCTRSVKRENEIYKAAVADGSAEKISNTRVSKKNVVLYVRCVVFTLAVALIVLGIFNDGIADVYGKAIRICTECIGLG